MSKVDSWFLYHKEFYYDAFGQSYANIWQGLPEISGSKEELYLLSYYRALMSFLRDDPEAIVDRRKLLFSYLLSDFKADADDDLIVRMRKQLPVKSIVSRVLSRVCSAYDEQPKRVYSDNAYTDVNMRAIYDNGTINGDLRQIYARARYTGFVLVRPIVKNNKWMLDYMTPDQFRVSTNPDDAKEIIAVTYPVAHIEGGHNTIRYVRWTQDARIELDVRGNVVASENNPYGELPFVALHIGAQDSIYNGGMWSLLEGQMELNKIKFLTNINATFSSWGVWVATNMSNPKISAGRLISFTNVKLGEGLDVPPELKFVAPEPLYSELNEFAVEANREMQQNEGIPASMLNNDNTPASGIARVIEREELNEIRIQDQEQLKSFEQSLSTLIAIVSSVDTTTKIDTKTIAVVVTFRDEVLYLEPEQEYALDKTKLMDGVVSVEDFLSKWSTMTGNEPELINELKRRRALVAELFSTGTTVPTTVEPEDAEQ